MFFFFFFFFQIFDIAHHGNHPWEHLGKFGDIQNIVVEKS